MNAMEALVQQMRVDIERLWRRIPSVPNPEAGLPAIGTFDPGGDTFKNPVQTFSGASAQSGPQSSGPDEPASGIESSGPSGWQTGAGTGGTLDPASGSDRLLSGTYLEFTLGVTMQSAASASPGDVAWSNPTNALADDGSNATCFISSQQSETLVVTNSSVAVPAGANILGIRVGIRRHHGGTAPSDVTIQLTKDGSTGVGDNKAGDVSWDSSPRLDEYGGLADLWGTTWTAAEINASTFGVLIKGSTAGTTTLRVDAILLQVRYGV